MLNHDASSLNPTSPCVAEGLALVERIVEGASNYPDQLCEADDEHVAQMVGYLRSAAEALGVGG